ncbi:ABC transporter substrate-binding protein [Evansella cellulosilytica]|uniref:Extracellular solute-binding protein family 1 n=1 Tax=Evansella cellulosilytica (strain ATCC 21833 / DSM 2522 / FERM P-1141 / JCM 9156 / N-4) TaxID=649639 RepID=E6TQZ0_EVAC2|nr:sugar ABC transporter substrate-binding protein [Evansella cellulosilytica]ADU29366.1 extracellular solute-binding protein family 1 [Evansella cellulosilytica DSM 2522]
MKKRLFFLSILSLLVVLLLGACGDDTESTGENAGDNGGSTDEAPTGSDEEVELRFALWDSNQEPGLRQIANDFEEENPNIKINIEVIGWSDYWTMLEAGATGGSLPDVFWMHSNEIFRYASNEMLLDLNERIQSSDVVEMDKFPEGLKSIYNFEGVQYAIPKDYDTIGLWYNKTMFDEAGVDYPDDTWTWDDLYDAAKQLTKDDGSQYGILTPLHSQEGYYNFVYQNGGTIITDDKRSGYDDPKTIEALEFYINFVREGLSPESYSDAERATFLENGIAAMGFFGSWNLTGFTENEYMAENFDVTVLPATNDGGRASIFNGLGNAIAYNTEHPEEAWKWVEYLSSKEAQTRQAELGIAISAYEGAADDWVNSNDIYNIEVFIDMVDYAQIRPYSNTTIVWEDRAYEALIGAFTGEKTVEEAAKDAAAIMNESLEQEQ